MIPDKIIGIIGLGYVGLPLAIEFAKKYSVLGFDIDAHRIDELEKGYDRTKEADVDDLKALTNPHFTKNNSGLHFSSNPDALSKCNVFIITVPTPVNEFKAPDLNPLLKASATVGSALKKGDIVIYESTVYPGCTEEDCVPVLERVSGLVFNTDFFAGYSPERINPGDKINTLVKIKKVTSGSTTDIAKVVDELYSSIITAGTHLAPSIKVAEASKAIENAQRDVNISYINELALIFDRIGIDTNDVLEAAATKWNFLKYKPGLVGGHCIGVDPYYLAHKAKSLGYHPEVILSGRKVNDNMGMYVANKVVKMMINKEIKIKGARVLILGITFKENCPDVRNTRVVDIYAELKQFGVLPEVYDPWADADGVTHEYGIKLSNQPDENNKYDGIILAVAHNEFLQIDWRKHTHKNSVIYDTKACLNREIVDGRL